MVKTNASITPPPRVPGHQFKIPNPIIFYDIIKLTAGFCGEQKKIPYSLQKLFQPANLLTSSWNLGLVFTKWGFLEKNNAVCAKCDQNRNAWKSSFVWNESKSFLMERSPIFLCEPGILWVLMRQHTGMFAFSINRFDRNLLLKRCRWVESVRNGCCASFRYENIFQYFPFIFIIIIII